MLLDANRDSRVMLRVADTGLLGLARGTMWIVSWKSGLTTDIRGPHRAWRRGRQDASEPYFI